MSINTEHTPRLPVKYCLCTEYYEISGISMERLVKGYWNTVGNNVMALVVADSLWRWGTPDMSRPTYFIMTIADALAPIGARPTATIMLTQV